LTSQGLFLPGPVSNAELFAYDYATEGVPDAERLKKVDLIGFPTDAELHTLGMAYHAETSTLFLTNHARAGPRVERFRLDAASLAATHVDTIRHPLLRGPNSISALGPDEILVTNDHHFTVRDSRLLAHAETYLGLPLGAVVHVNLRGADVRAEVVARVPFANGVEVLNSSTVAVSSTSRGSVYFYTRRGDALDYHSQLRLPFLPDNLSSAGDKLLIAGHAHMPSLVEFTKTRHICNDPAELTSAAAETREYCKTGTAPSWVSEWSEAGGLRDLYVDTEYPSSSTMVRDEARNVAIVVGLYAKGIMAMRE
jgi:arylesterase/paraoxonase